MTIKDKFEEMKEHHEEKNIDMNLEKKENQNMN